MGLFRFLNRIPKPLQNPQLSLHKTIQNPPLLTPSGFLRNQNHLHEFFFSSPFPHFSSPQSTSTRAIYRSLHNNSGKTQLNDQDNRNSDAKSTPEAEKICQLLFSTSQTSGNLDSVLANSVLGQVTPALVIEVLKKLSNAGAFALSFFRWAERQKGFEHTSESYNALIEALGKIKQFQIIWDLVNEMEKKGVLNRDTFALVTRRYARARKADKAIYAFERMEKFGLRPELSDFNRLIDTLSKSRHVEKAQEVFDKWKNKRFRPDIKSYAILLEGWGQEKNLLRLNEVYREMKDDGFEPDVVSYGIIINAYCKARKYDEAVEMYREMEGQKIKATPHIYCTLINGLGAERRLSEALEYFELCKTSGYEIEVPTYNAVVGAYCWSMRMHDAYRIVDEMKQLGVGPNTRTYDIILHHLIKAKRTKEAYSVFQRMSDEFGCEPTVSTYEIMVRMFCNEERTDMAVRVWDQMKAKGVLPGMHMFSILINSLCYQSGKLDDACKYFHEMLDMGIRAPTQLFKNLKRELLDEGKNDTVLDLTRRLDILRKSSLVG